MAIVPAYPFNLLNGTIADATQVMADFDSVKNSVNSNAAANGANSDITSLTGLTTPLSIAQGGSGTATPGSGVAGTVGGYRNILRRNGAIQIWQRGAGGAASFAVAASSTVYTADGWYLNTGANQASVVSQQAGINSPSQWCAKVQRNSGQTGVAQMLFGFPLDTDELYPALGQFVRLSFVAKAGSNWSPNLGILTAALSSGTGVPVKFSTGFTGSTLLINQGQTLTTTATRFQVTSNAIVPINARQLEVYFVWTPTGTAGADDSFYVDDVQLEIVPAATGYVSSDFERLNFREQLLLCQRHYQKTFNYGTAPADNAGSALGGLSEVLIITPRGATAVNYMPYRFNPIMRNTPVVTLYNPTTGTAGQAYDTIASAVCSATTAQGISMGGMRVNTTSAGTTAIGNLLEVHLQADAGI